MKSSSIQRFLRPTSKGVFNWLGQPVHGVERTLYETLVLYGIEKPFALREIASEIGVAANDLARALFALNRSESISLLDIEPDRHHKGWGQPGLADLPEILASAALPGQKFLLSTADGFQLARVGYGLYEAEAMAVELLHGKTENLLMATDSMLPVYIQDQTLILSSSQKIDKAHGAWLHLAYRLLASFSKT